MVSAALACAVLCVCVWLCVWFRGMAWVAALLQQCSSAATHKLICGWVDLVKFVMKVGCAPPFWGSSQPD